MKFEKLICLFTIFANPLLSSSTNNFCSIDEPVNTTIYDPNTQKWKISKLWERINQPLKKLKSKLSSIADKTKPKLNTCKLKYRSYKDKRILMFIEKHMKNYNSLVLSFLECNKAINDSIIDGNHEAYFNILQELHIRKDFFLYIKHLISEEKEAIKMASIALSNIDIRNKDGSTALHLAIGYKNYELVKLLIDAGASLEKINSNKDSAISSAAVFRNKEIVNFIIKAGSNLYDAKLSNLDFREASFDNINFRCSELIMADFSKALLRGADFRGALLDSSNFMDADLHQAIMEKAQLKTFIHNDKSTIIVWENFIEYYLMSNWGKEMRIEVPKDIALFIITHSYFI